jgi:hypothetical protein
MNKSSFKSPEFEKFLENTLERISNYLIETNYKLENIKLKDLIQWHDEGPKGPRRVYPHTDCPIEIKGVIERIIIEEFNKK